MQKTFAIFGNRHKAGIATNARQILDYLRAKGDADKSGSRDTDGVPGTWIYIEPDFRDFLYEQSCSVEGTRRLMPSDLESVDFAISIGGDGTFLNAANHIGSRNIPIVGINMGRLGFLADVPVSEAEQCIEALYEGDYAVEERKVISVEADGEDFRSGRFALNDVAVLKRDMASMISIRAAVNGEYLTTYQADGLVVSTPTGSTAYSLSVGGPIIAPGTNVLVLTAVAPHSLNIRPIVLPDTTVITLDVESRNHNFLIAMDGRSEPCPEDKRVTIRSAAHTVKIIKLPGGHYFTTLREKMMWGADKRRP